MPPLPIIIINSKLMRLDKMIPKIVMPDSKGRITLGHNLTKDVSGGYKLIEIEDGRIILEPYVEIPVHEKWLFENKAVLGNELYSLAECFHSVTS